MSKKFLIAESNNDISILRKLIPSQYSNNVKFVAGKGYSAATSLASSLLYDRPDSYVILVLDADTTDPSVIQERYNFLDWQLSRMSVDRSYAIFLFVPTIEALFIDNGIIQHEQKLSIDPKVMLSKALEKSNISIAEFMNNLSPDDLKKLRSNQTVQAIINAVQQEMVQT